MTMILVADKQPAQNIDYRLRDLAYENVRSNNQSQSLSPLALLPAMSSIRAR
jgi:hypothetical protein